MPGLICMQDGRTCLPGLESKNAHVFFSNQAMAEQCPQCQLHRLRLARYVNNQTNEGFHNSAAPNDRSLFSNAVKVGSRRSRQTLHTRTKRVSASQSEVARETLRVRARGNTHCMVLVLRGVPVGGYPCPLSEKKMLL